MLNETVTVVCNLPGLAPHLGLNKRGDKAVVTVEEAASFGRFARVVNPDEDTVGIWVERDPVE